MYSPYNKESVDAEICVQRGQQEKTRNLGFDYFEEMGERLVFGVENRVAIDNPNHGEESKPVDALEVRMGSARLDSEQFLCIGP